MNTKMKMRISGAKCRGVKNAKTGIIKLQFPGIIDWHNVPLTFIINDKRTLRYAKMLNRAVNIYCALVEKSNSDPAQKPYPYYMGYLIPYYLNNDFAYMISEYIKPKYAAKLQKYANIINNLVNSIPNDIIKW